MELSPPSALSISRDFLKRVTSTTHKFFTPKIVLVLLPLVIWALLTALLVFYGLFLIQRSLIAGLVIFDFGLSLLASPQGLWLLPITLFVLWQLWFVHRRFFPDLAVKNRVKAVGVQMVTLVCLSYLSAIFILIGLGVTQMNRIRYQISQDHTYFEWGVGPAVTALREREVAPKIWFGEEGVEDILMTIVVSEEVDFGAWFKESMMLKASSEWLEPIQLPAENILFTHNTLFIRAVDPDQLEALSPVLGRLITADYLTNHSVKDEPVVNVWQQEEYLRYRQAQIEQQVQKLESIFVEIQSILGQTNAYIARAEEAIIFNGNSRNQILQERDSRYRLCTTSTYTDSSGERVRSFSDSQCEEDKSYYDQLIGEFETSISQWQAEMGRAQAQAAYYSQVLNQINGYIALVDEQQQHTIFELGLFEPEATISVVWQEGQDLEEYWSTLVHEYFHYTSYAGEDALLPLFFEESLTEWFSREALDQVWGINPDLGYEVFVVAIERLLEPVNQDQLLDIYLTKNTDQLADTLNQLYGEDFYQKHEQLFDLVPFLAVPEQLGVINAILEDAGLEPLTAADFVGEEIKGF